MRNFFNALAEAAELVWHLPIVCGVIWLTLTLISYERRRRKRLAAYVKRNDEICDEIKTAIEKKTKGEK